jgi:ribonuclease J
MAIAPPSSSLRLFALGGLGEVGMNCLCLEQRGRLLVIDCGVTFAEQEYGVDVVHADFAALEPWRDRIAGVALTHGHEDHIGALPYLLRRFDVPVYGPRHALALVHERLVEHGMAFARLNEVPVGRRTAVGGFYVEPIRVTHSIADATALAIETDVGIVIHTGDFKIDPDPPDGEHFDAARFEELGDEGVALLMSDSTNVDAAGPTGSERIAGEGIARAAEGAQGVVVVAMFASNVQRLRMLGALAQRLRRRIVLLGRSVETHVRVARATGYVDWPEDLQWPAERLGELPRSEVLAVVAGTQGEPRGAFARLARGEHADLSLGEGDRLILSSRVIPGNELLVLGLVSALRRRGVDVRTPTTDRELHVSGHAHREEQRRMLDLVRPRCFVPVHGTLHHLERHAALAREAGVEQALVLENGDVGETDGVRLWRADRIAAKRARSFAGRPVAPEVVGQRASLAERGVVSIVLVHRATGLEVLAEQRGVADPSAVGPLLDDVRAEVAHAHQEAPPGQDDERRAEALRHAVRRTVHRALGFRPTVLVTEVRP